MNSTFESYYYLVKNNLIKQTRSYPFLLVIGMSIFIGYACVPDATAGYEVFYIGGVRGLYNSAWLGGMVAMLSTLLLWLFGFYLLRNQVSEDHRLKVGQIIASTPISNMRYISSKVLSHFLLLLVIESITVVAFMAMQLLRGEEYHIQVWGYFAPFLFIALPSLLVLAALTIFFDVAPGLKGVVGNILFFFLWIFFSVISIASPNSFWDLYGLDSIRSDMVEEAATQYEFIKDGEEGGSFGYYPMEEKIATFVWQGVEWDSHILLQRVIWLGMAIIVTMLSAMMFSRFKNEKRNSQEGKVLLFESKRKQETNVHLNQVPQLSPVEKDKQVSLSRLVKAELQIMLKGHSIWWYLVAIGMVAGSFLLPLDQIRSWLPVIMVFPIAMWSQMGTREKYYFTQELIFASCPPLYKFFAVWISGVLVTLLVSIGAIVHFLIDGELSLFYSWMTGVFFIPTTGLALGVWSGSRKLFEVIYMLWWYLGPVNDIPYLDFLGVSTSYNGFYLNLTLVLLGITIVVQLVKTGHLQSGFKKAMIEKEYSNGGIDEKFK
ncbi:hypothetical protein ACQKL5_12920 [Peribacillus sp. NPDC097675]|uniref:hypothetical protein n=1 Tax=Peribacillus sp. NPDC097675 TaxID=3390618 RepID=UPI003D03DEA2